MVKEYKGSTSSLFHTPDTALKAWFDESENTFDKRDLYELRYALHNPHLLSPQAKNANDALIELIILGVLYARSCRFFPDMPQYSDDDDDSDDDGIPRHPVENLHIQPHDEGMVKKYDLNHKKDDDDV